MAYETSYDAGLNPFNHDKSREKWSRPSDFLFACIGHAFKIDSIYMATSFFLIDAGIYGVFAYFIVVATCVMPLIFLQSFLGQFSSTGFISVFRIAPLCKGIGFAALILNLSTLAYYSIFAAVPMFYFFNTLRPTIPWSCEGIKSWMVPEENITTPCENNVNLSDYTSMAIPSMEYLLHHINMTLFLQEETPDSHFSWPLLMCNALIWILVGFVMSKNLDMISKFLRYSCMAVCSLIALFLLRFSFLPGAFNELSHVFHFSPWHLYHALSTVPMAAFATLGPGWGSILTMASFNRFKTDIFRSGWIVCLAHFGVVMGLTLINALAAGFLRRDDPDHLYILSAHSMWVELLMVPSALTFVGLTRILTVTFLCILILGSLNLIVVQLLSLLTSLFDEYPKLRPLKMEVTMGLVGGLGLISIYSSHNHGMHFFTILAQFSLVTQMLLNLLLILVVLWIYGREKFQRDVQFMTTRTYPTWMVGIVRFVAPCIIVLVLLIGYYSSQDGCFDDCSPHSIAMWSITFISFAPWVLIPVYCAFKVLQTSGAWRERIMRTLRPTDWYPAESEDRQNYDELFSATETVHQLTTNIE